MPGALAGSASSARPLRIASITSSDGERHGRGGAVAGGVDRGQRGGVLALAEALGRQRERRRTGLRRAARGAQLTCARLGALGLALRHGDALRALLDARRRPRDRGGDGGRLRERERERRALVLLARLGQLDLRLGG